MLDLYENIKKRRSALFDRKSEAKLKQKKSPQPKPGAMNKQGIYSVILWRWGNMKVCCCSVVALLILIYSTIDQILRAPFVSVMQSAPSRSPSGIKKYQ